jgi:hypothetical protein
LEDCDEARCNGKPVRPRAKAFARGQFGSCF